MTESIAKGKAIFATSYFPPISQLSAMLKQPEVFIELHETFPKQTLRNRTVIMTANGPMALTVPVTRPNGNHTITGEIRISYTERWNVVHWRAIESAYNASPYFLFYRDEIEKTLFEKYTLLADLNNALLDIILKSLKCNCQYSHTKEYIRASNKIIDYRNTFSYKHPERHIESIPYPQVFADRFQFVGNLGIMDLLFNLGPESLSYLQNLPMQKPWNM